MGNFHEGEEWQDEYRRAKNEYLRALLVLLIFNGLTILFFTWAGGKTGFWFGLFIVITFNFVSWLLTNEEEM